MYNSMASIYKAYNVCNETVIIFNATVILGVILDFWKGVVMFFVHPHLQVQGIMSAATKSNYILPLV